MSIDHYDLLNWSDCWPMGFRGRYKWRLRFITMTEVKALRTCWRNDNNRKRPSMATAFRRIMKHNWRGAKHEIESRSRASSIEVRPFAIVIRGIVFDGNHTLWSLMARGYRGRVLIGETRSRPKGKHPWVSRKGALK